jgi:hypothetical protein
MTIDLTNKRTSIGIIVQDKECFVIAARGQTICYLLEND